MKLRTKIWGVLGSLSIMATIFYLFIATELKLVLCMLAIVSFYLSLLIVITSLFIAKD